MRTCAAGMYASAAFGPLVAAEAQARASVGAGRQALVADGQQYNGSIRRADFPPFEPIADFRRAPCYLYPAAWAVHPEQAAHRQPYVAGMTACWRGRVAVVAAGLAGWQERRGRPRPGRRRWTCGSGGTAPWRPGRRTRRAWTSRATGGRGRR